MIACAVEPESRNGDEEEVVGERSSVAKGSKSRQNVRASTRKEDSDSDFEFDL